MVPLFYDVERRKSKVLVFLGWSRRPIVVSFARPPQATILDVSGRPPRNSPSIRWGRLRAQLPYPVTAELYAIRFSIAMSFAASVTPAAHARRS